MNLAHRRLTLLSLLCLLAIPALPLSAQQLEISNDVYSHRVQLLGGAPLFVIDGFTPVKDDARTLPRRTLRNPVDERGTQDYRLVSVRYADPVLASPWYQYMVERRKDSSLALTLQAATPVAGESGTEARILRKVYTRERGVPELLIDVPLLTWDAVSNQTRWIESYTFERFERDNLRSPFAAEGKPPYASQPFVTRGNNVDTTQAWIDMGNPMLRFFVREDGLYKITAAWLRDAGVDPATINPARLQMYRKGVAVPVWLEGMDDGRFDEADFILFRGTRNYDERGHKRIPASDDEPCPQYISIYTDSTAYWLNFNVANPARITRLDLRAQNFTDTLDWAYRNMHFEYDWDLRNANTSIVRTQLPDWTASDTWYIGEMGVGATQQRFFFDNLVPARNARAWIKVVSWFGNSLISPNHATTLSINAGPALDSVAFSLDEQALMFAEFPASILSDGDDTLRLVNHNVQGTGYSSIMVDWYEVEYPRSLFSNARQWDFRIDESMKPGPTTIAMRSTGSGDAWLLRSTANGATLLPSIAPGAQRPDTWLFADTLIHGAEYLFTHQDSLRLPSPGERRTITPIVTPGEQASYILVAADELLPSSRTYADFIRTRYGVSVKVVGIGEVYDNYSYGMFLPEAIKMLTFDAFHAWTTDSLRHVFLVGDANYNYRFATGPYSRNLVPSYGSPVSDIWFACFDTLQIRPSFAVGRLSARTNAEVDAYRRKHEAYLDHPFDLWNKSTVHFSGGDLNKGDNELLKYKAINQYVVDNLVTLPPFSGNVTHFFKNLDPQSDFGPYTDAWVKQRIQEGGVFISYVGHSGTATWDNSISSPTQIENAAGRGSLVTDFGCSTGRFAEPDIVSFSEAAVVPEGSQFIGYIGNASAGFESTTSILPFLYFGALINDRAPSVGDALVKSKFKLQDQYGTHLVNTVSTLTNLLVGDPIVAMALPKLPNPRIRSAWIRPEQEIITDVMDSVTYRVIVGNYGLQTQDSLDVRIDATFGAQALQSLSLRIGMPAIYDTLFVTLAAPKKAGRASLRVLLDEAQTVEEIYENDNEALITVDVLSTYLNVVNERLDRSSGRRDSVRILNPVFGTGNVSTAILEVDSTTAFATPRSITAPYGITQTSIPFPSDPTGSSWYWRARLDGGATEYVGPYRRSLALDADVVQADSADFSHAVLEDARVYNGAVTLLPTELEIEAESAGFPAKFGAIRLNGINILKSTFFRGYAIAVFDSLSMKLKRFAQFDNWGVATDRDSIRVWIEGVQAGEVVVVTTADEPQAGSNVFRAAMKSIGSVLIDSVRIANRSSWAIIGHKGAAAGSVPEGFYRAGEGYVLIKKNFSVIPDTGTISSPVIGPAAAWGEVMLQRSDVASTDIRVQVSGIDTAGIEVPLIAAANTGSLSLAGIDAKQYPYIRLGATLYPAESAVPVLDAWGVKYTQPAELALNYQSVVVQRDTVVQGSPGEVRIGIINAGEADAAMVPVQVELVGSDNIPRPAASFTIPRIAAGAWFDSSVTFNTNALTGPYQVRVFVDREQGILEQHEDNNSYFTSMFVKADTTKSQLDIAFDGYMPVFGDYIRANPEIVLTLRTPPAFPLTSREGFRVTIDGDALDLDSVKASFTPSVGNTPAMLRFQPQLADGEYYFGFNARDGNDQLAFVEDLEVLVRVTTANRITQLYNYPNPIVGATDFTFILTGSTPPDEVQVKIFTVAGRLIRTLNYPGSATRIGFNSLKWDGRDEDGDLPANGVYFYKVISKFNDTTAEEIGRMAVMR